MAKMKIKRPFDVLEQAKNKFVLIDLGKGKKISGILRCFDAHLNIVLEDAVIGNRKYPFKRN